MNKTYHPTWRIRTKAYISASAPKPDFRKKTLVQLIAVIGMIAFTTSEAYASCSDLSNKNCITKETNSSPSTYSGNTTNFDGYIANDNTDPVNISTSDKPLNNSLTIINNAGASDLNVTVKNTNIKNIYSLNNSGKAAISITTTTDMTTPNGFGISVSNAGTNLTLNTKNINSQTNAIYAVNYGTGATSITTADITSSGSNGIYAQNSNNTTDLTITTGTINANQNGLYLKNSGTGTTSITINGDVTSANSDAIYAENDPAATDLTINTKTINGKNNGIYAANFGTGSTTVTAEGNITATNQNGIYAFNHGKDLTINTHDVQGSQSGIYATNEGTGSTTITAKGNITATNSDAIHIENKSNTKDLIIKTDNVNAKMNGIYTTNNGTGITSITVSNDIIAANSTGIFAQNLNTASNLNINAKNINANLNGIYVINNGTGSTSITTSGTIQGLHQYGIHAENNQTGTDISINQTNGSITGALDGIDVLNRTPHGNNTVTVTGKVTGGTGAGIYTSGSTGTTTSITLNSGANIEATSGIAIRDADDNAIVTLNNGSKVTGEITLGNGSDTLNINSGADTSAISVLDGGDDTSDSDGMIDTLNISQSLTGSSSSNGTTGNIGIRNWENINLLQQSTLTLTGDLNTSNLNIDPAATLNLIPSLHQAVINGNITNSGNLSLSNNQAGDHLTINGNYIGNNGTITLDTISQDNNSATDKLFINGNASGRTTVRMNNTNGLGADTGTTDGIEIINITGNSTNNAFNLQNDHIDAGAYEYHLYKGNINGQNSNWYLRSQLAKPDNPNNPNNPNNP
ncbi:autotransporter outer membrane beta-barrel domain-containing protein, partial [Snodgrassella alvi]|uniref:autotransporter outer membrane beta-barrel domain-containing protein n=1 Tax=Snodgrassella alvi TaxID=1196083 RepID=UPI00117AD1FD